MHNIEFAYNSKINYKVFLLRSLSLICFLFLFLLSFSANNRQYFFFRFSCNNSFIFQFLFQILFIVFSQEIFLCFYCNFFRSGWHKPVLKLKFIAILNQLFTRFNLNIVWIGPLLNILFLLLNS